MCNADAGEARGVRQGEVEVSVLFAPTREEACAATAWCQLEGRAERLPLALCGQGLGPQVRLVSVHGALQRAVPAGPSDDSVRLRAARQRTWRATRLARRRQAAPAQATARGARASVACGHGGYARARQASFAFDRLDVKDALVGAPYMYEADLMNRRAAQGPMPHM